MKKIIFTRRSFSKVGILFCFPPIKKIGISLCLLFFSFHFSFSQGVWTWMGGDTISNSIAEYGTQGIPSICRAQSQALPPKANSGWTITHPFQHTVFIENKGQFAEDEKQVGHPILYYNRLGKVQMYFSAGCITFRYDSIIKADDDANTGKLKDPDQDINLRDAPQFLTMTWQNANPNATVEVQEPESDYFTYSNTADKSGHSGIVAHAWKKLIYHNVYNGIDAEFYYPAKGGIEYNIIVHPGVDISKVKIAYSGNVQMSGNDVNILSPGLNLTEHQPIAWDDKGNKVATSFSVNHHTLAFKTAAYDKTETLVIDPWITNPNLFIYNIAYDVAYDNNGNVYIAGGQAPYELQQYDSTGKLNWSFTATVYGGPPDWYGCFTTDVRSGSSYFFKGLNVAINPNVNAVKINNAGMQVAQDNDSLPVGPFSGIELWRVAFDYINNQLVCAAGLQFQAAILDTNLASINHIVLTGDPNNALAHDMSLLALDGQDNAYMGTNASSFSDPNYYNNVLLKLSLPALSPVSDTVSDHYGFDEFLSLYYYSPQVNGGYDYSNGFNGMAADKNMVVTYDGATLKKWRSFNHILKEKDSLKVSGTMFQWGGLDLDCNGNIYAGNKNSVNVYDSSFHLINTLPLNNNVYALKVGNGKLYSCGYGFVQSVNVNANPIQTFGVSANPVSFCPGESATLTVSGINSGNAYTWAPATGLSATTGTIVTAKPTVTTTYTVTATNQYGCTATNSVTVTVGAGSQVITVTPSAAQFCLGGTPATLIASGSINYTWAPSTGLNITSGATVLANPTIATTYTVIGSNNSGCMGTTIATVQPIPVPAIGVFSNSFSNCRNEEIGIQAYGASNYIWRPSIGLNDTIGEFVTATDAVTTTYTVTGFENGCPGSKTYTLVIDSTHIRVNSAAICKGNPATLIATGAQYISDWIPRPNSNDSTGYTVIVYPTVTTTYEAQGYDAGRCPDTGYAVVTVDTGLALTVPTPNPICAGQSTILSVTSGGQYTWAPTAGLSATTGSTVTASPTVSTTYVVHGKSGPGCEGTTSVPVIVKTSPYASFKYTATGNQVSFNSDSVSNDVISYSWNFGDNQTSNDSNPVHTFDSVKTYYVCLSVYNGSNCSYTFCRYVSTLTGVEDITGAHFIQLYPNPANDELTVEVLNAAAPKQITIADDLGRALIQLNTYKTKTLIDVSSLAAGIYFVKTQLSDGSVEVGKFVKE